jgi:hypothetical protein
VANCLRGAFPPVDLRAVCFVRAISIYEGLCVDALKLKRKLMFASYECTNIYMKTLGAESKVKEKMSEMEEKIILVNIF